MATLSFVYAWIAFANALPNDVSVDPARRAIERALPRIEQGAANYTTHRTCFSCHHQAMALLSLSSARDRGFAVDQSKIQKQIDFTLKTFQPIHDDILKGQGIPGGNTQTGYALFALDAVRHPSDQTAQALIEYLLVRQKADGSWPALAKRPPTEGSSFTNTALAVRALVAGHPCFPCFYEEFVIATKLDKLPDSAYCVKVEVQVMSSI